jgi:hypothetical protein
LVVSVNDVSDGADKGGERLGKGITMTDKPRSLSPKRSVKPFNVVGAPPLGLRGMHVFGNDALVRRISVGVKSSGVP